MKKDIKIGSKVIKIMLLSSLLCTGFGINNVSALEDDKSDNGNIGVNEIFAPSQVAQDVEKANALTVVPDPKAPKTRSAYGSYPTRKGVILATSDAYKGLIPTGHAAIIYTSSSVVESISNGVVIGKNNWNTSKNQAYGVTVSSTSSAQDAAAADYCYGKRGIKYNYSFFDINTRTAFYCSQLVYAAYKDKYGIDLNTGDYGTAIHPMELVNTSKTSLVYRKK